MPRRSLSSETERREVLDLYRSSGLSLREYGERMGIPHSTLKHWLQRESRERVARLLPVRVAEEPEAGEPGDCEYLEVSVGPATVRVQRGFDASHLVRVVTALRSC